MNIRISPVSIAIGALVTLGLFLVMGQAGPDLAGAPDSNGGSWIQWCDAHQGGITALATVSLVLLTGFYVWYTRNLLKATVALRRPDVVVSIENNPEEFLFFNFVVSNSGMETAHSVSFTHAGQEHDLVWEILRKHGMISRGIPCLPSGRQMTSCLASSIDAEALLKATCAIKVAYVNRSGQSFSENVILDMSVFEGMSRVGVPAGVRLAKATEQAQTALGRIASALDHMKSKAVSIQQDPPSSRS